ncbi:MAG: hypothetical protein SRB2_03930 [Desulfobacteraceae bacterium Eth-SRB2]|nr:MAG: hypothetical protein SRB2_03930 [Desulfobacteraceae bacterium Eth-SRB2]
MSYIHNHNFSVYFTLPALKKRVLIINFSQSIFIGADLTGADFSGANMKQCTLTNAVCVTACFSRSDLNYADFSHADLTSANLSGAVLFRANLHGIKDQGTVIDDRRSVLGIDQDLLASENWQPSY